MPTLADRAVDSISVLRRLEGPVGTEPSNRDRARWDGATYQGQVYGGAGLVCGLMV